MHDRRRRAALVLAVAAAAVAACMAVVPGASAAPARPAGGAQRLAAGNPWGQAQEVPGIAALNKEEDAWIASVSCGAAGNCSAGGYYASGHRPSGRKIFQAFVVSEVNGTWRKAEEVPGTAALNKRGNAQTDSVSCASAGNCSAGGYYAKGHTPAGVAIIHAFVVSEVHGTWRKAEEVPGTAALDKRGAAQVTSVSCASAGNCSAGGWYASAAGLQAFVVSEVRGTWRKAEELPGSAALNKGADAEVTSVSCASAGNCSAGGWYSGAGVSSGIQRAFVVSEVHGTWRKAEELPGTAAVTKSKGGFAQITSVSCGAAGNCSAVGEYSAPHTANQAFVASEVRGTWRKAEDVPGIAALSNGGTPFINSVSCASARNCSAGGSYLGSRGFSDAFVVSEVNGTWRKAEDVPGAAALSNGGAWITSVSCASAGNCSAGGIYGLSPAAEEPFVVSEVNGIWQRAGEVPGAAALSNGGAGITSVSCGSAGHCSAGGGYLMADGGAELFVVSRK